MLLISDLVWYMMTFLCIRETCRSARTSQRWVCFVRNSLETRECVHITAPFSISEVSGIIAVIDKWCPNLTELTTKYFTWHHIVNQVSSCLLNRPMLLDRLRVVSVVRTTTVLSVERDLLKNMRSISFNIQEPDAEWINIAVAQKLPNLQHLSLTNQLPCNWYIELMVRCMPQLRTLNLDVCGNISRHVICRLPNLIALSMKMKRYCSSWVENILEAPRSLICLEVLIWHDSEPDLALSSIQLMVNRFPCLKYWFMNTRLDADAREFFKKNPVASFVSQRDAPRIAGDGWISNKHVFAALRDDKWHKWLKTKK